MDLKDIKNIVALMNEHELSYFHLEQGEFNLKLKKGPDADSIASMLSAIPQVAASPAAIPAAAPAAAIPAAAPVASADDAEAITSPMVGTFYRKPSPDADNFVEVGTTVSEGQTICIIEAMKVMNEIKAEKSGTIATLAVDDGTAVQFGDTLFTLK